VVRDERAFLWVAPISAKHGSPCVLEYSGKLWSGRFSPKSTPSAKSLRVYFAGAQRLEPAPVNSSAEMPSGRTVIWREPPCPGLRVAIQITLSSSRMAPRIDHWLVL
jgi:hypothetical protein